MEEIIIRWEEFSMYYYVKGAAEIVTTLCRPESIPATTDASFTEKSRKGLRVLAIAYKQCRDPLATTMSQDDLEGDKDLIFVGLLCLSNRLRPESATVVSDLKKAGISVNMITGDNVYAAVTTARRCGILGPLVENSNALSTLGSPGNKAMDVSGKVKPRPVGRVYIIEALDDAKNKNMEEGAIQITNADTGNLVESELSWVLEEAVLCKFRQRQHFVKQAMQKEAKKRAQESGLGLGLLVPAGHLDEDPAAAPLTPSSNTASTYGTVPEEGANTLGGVDNGGIAVDDEEGATEIIDDNFIELAVTSSGLAAIKLKYPDGLLLNTICRTAKVFARAQPKDKKFVVDEIAHKPDGLKFGQGDSLPRDDVLFCGDGANDMEAMHTATLGISLCDVEVSVAAPITSWSRSPSAVLQVLYKGRWSLSLVYATLHTTLLSSTVWLLQDIIMLWFLTESTDCMYVVLNLLVLCLQTSILMDSPKDELTVAQMPKKYFGYYLFYQLVPQVVLFLGFQVLTIIILQNMSFYEPYTTDDIGDVLESTTYVATVEQNLTMGQMLIAAVLSYIGEPFRRDWSTNYIFTSFIVLGAVWVIYQCFAGGSTFAVDFLGLVETPFYFGWIMVSLIGANAILAYLVKEYTSSIADPTLYTQRDLPLFSKSLEDKWEQMKKLEMN